MRLPFGRIAFLGAFLAVVSFAFVTLRGPRGIGALLDINRQIAAKEVSNAKLAQQVGHLQDRIEQLKNDPAEQEIEIRRRLKLMKKGEKMYVPPESKGKE
jgi:cell division protein FtsB